MPVVTSSIKERAALIIPRVEARLAPAMPLDVLAQVKRLLGFYYKDPKESAGEIAAAAELWVEILCEFPERAVYGAIKEYLRNDKKGHKPKPGQIVELARQQVSKERALIGLCKAILNAPIAQPEPDRTPPTEAEKEAVSKLLADALGPNFRHNRQELARKYRGDTRSIGEIMEEVMAPAMTEAPTE